MENVLVAVIIIFLLIFVALSFSEALISSQDLLQVGFREMEERLGEQTRTNLSPIDEPLFVSANDVTYAYRNTGSTRLADFDRWDVIVQYFDDADPANYHIERLNYVKNTPVGHEWTVGGIYLDADQAVEEMFEPGILDPGEEIVFTLNLMPPVGPGQTIQALVAAPNGVSTSSVFTRNIPPELVTNLGLTITHGEVGVIDNTLLLTTDQDNEPQDLVYTVLTTPVGGILSPSDGFTQANIDGGLLTYTNDISGDYSFEFTVTDARDTIGPYIFGLSVVNAEPILATNAGLTLKSGSAPITSAMLQATDADDLPDNLTFTVTTMPTKGTLSPGTVFTQEHIDSGLLTYTRTAGGNDSFEFSLSDGENMIGPFTFQISV